jgi:DNA-binding CsgD family transcriptional regulator
MSQGHGSKLKTASSIVRGTRGTGASPGMDAGAKRRLIADVCKVVAARVGALDPEACNERGLSPRQRQTLRHLLAGDGEKQVAAKLGVSKHTVHVYAKALHKHFGVSSRSELLAKCLSPQIAS